MSRSLAAAALIGALACKATPPGRIEQIVATEVKRRITVGGRADPNPVPTTPEAIRDGETAFVANCSMCHGVDGRNTGVPFARTMSPPVPELTSRDVQEYTDGQLHSIVENGLSPSGMPAARGILSDDEMWRVVLYIRQLAKDASVGAVCGRASATRRRRRCGSSPVSEAGAFSPSASAAMSDDLEVTEADRDGAVGECGGLVALHGHDLPRP